MQDNNKDTEPKVTEHILHMYTSSDKIYPREVKGTFAKIRDRSLVTLLIIFFITPWINWGDRQAILFDMIEKRFYIFNIVIWPQDLIVLSTFLLIMAFTLFFITALVGRVWCGYACPQTIWTESFIWIERFCEGSREKQIKLNKKPWTFEKIRKKAAKHFLWILLSLFTGLTFVGYFVAIRNLIPDFFTLNTSWGPAFWALFYAAITYLNAGWLREQFCTTMCPYARFQGAMYDENTLLVSYDKKRGEPRRSAKKGQNPDGHCINCNICVQVCPTGIDIRDGSQHECINCSLCIDACNDVMTKIEAPKNLIRYASENEINGKETKLLRPKTIGYGVFLLCGISTLFYMVANIKTIDLNVKRDRNVLARNAANNKIENIYTINILNKSLNTADYKIYAKGIDDLILKAKSTTVTIKSGEIYGVTIKLLADKSKLKSFNTPITIIAEELNSGSPANIATAESKFFKVMKK